MVVFERSIYVDIDDKRESLRNRRLLGVVEIDGVNIRVHYIVLNV